MQTSGYFFPTKFSSLSYLSCFPCADEIEVLVYMLHQQTIFFSRMPCHHLALVACVICLLFYFRSIPVFDSSFLIALYRICNSKVWICYFSLFVYYGFVVTFICKCWCLNIDTYKEILSHCNILEVIHSWASWTLGWIEVLVHMLFTYLLESNGLPPFWLLPHVWVVCLLCSSHWLLPLNYFVLSTELQKIWIIHLCSFDSYFMVFCCIYL